MLKDRITLILYYDEDIAFIYDICNMEILGVIDNDSSLIRYLLGIMELNNVRVNDSKYLILRNKKGIVTTLQRLIVEFYSRYDVKLKELLDNGYEINHINKNKLDNRLSNIEVVSHMDNIKHRDNQTYEVAYSTNSLIKLQDIVMSKDEYVKDTRYLHKMNKLFIDSIIKEESKNLDKWFACRYSNYLLFKNNTMNIEKITSIVRESNNRVTFSNIKKYSKKMAISKTNIDNLLFLYDKYIVYRTKSNNIKIIEELIKRNKYSNFRKLLEETQCIEILRDIFNICLYNEQNHIIIDDNIVVIVPIKIITREIRGKYKYLRELYILNILRRLNKVSSNKSLFSKQVPTSFIFPYLRRGDFTDIDNISKTLLFLNKGDITYSIVARVFGIDKADLVFRNSYLKSTYLERNTKTLEDIYTILSTNTILQKYGYITSEEILLSLKQLNENRKNKGEPFIDINNKTIRFIKNHLNIDIQLIKDLSKIGIKFVYLNNNTISSILAYQEELKNYSLYAGKKVIVLSKLYKK